MSRLESRDVYKLVTRSFYVLFFFSPASFFARFFSGSLALLIVQLEIHRKTAQDEWFFRFSGKKMLIIERNRNVSHSNCLKDVICTFFRYCNKVRLPKERGKSPDELLTFQILKFEASRKKERDRSRLTREIGPWYCSNFVKFRGTLVENKLEFQLLTKFTRYTWRKVKGRRIESFETLRIKLEMEYTRELCSNDWQLNVFISSDHGTITFTFFNANFASFSILWYIF